ncbi:c-type cytochrome [Reinekea sp.]|uniref:c-type cytochrome n=1 Tax=Reinekea sp. TaxID=1970455 RepID=UPI003989D5F5
MKKLLILITTLTASLVFAEYKSYEDEVAERLTPAGNVCIQGEVCETASVTASAADTGPKSGDQVYTTACAACHGTGVLNAPKLGSAEDWAPRQAKGLDTLYDHAINGFNTMPARGGNSALSDDEVKAAVDHMLSSL